MDPQLAKKWLEDSCEKAVKNVDLWQRLDTLTQQHTIEWRWVKELSGHPQNERCDELARTAAEGSSLKADTGFTES